MIDRDRHRPGIFWIRAAPPGIRAAALEPVGRRRRVDRCAPVGGARAELRVAHEALTLATLARSPCTAWRCSGRLPARMWWLSRFRSYSYETSGRPPGSSPSGCRAVITRAREDRRAAATQPASSDGVAARLVFFGRGTDSAWFRRRPSWWRSLTSAGAAGRRASTPAAAAGGARPVRLACLHWRSDVAAGATQRPPCCWRTALAGAGGNSYRHRQIRAGVIALAIAIFLLAFAGIYATGDRSRSRALEESARPRRARLGVAVERLRISDTTRAPPKPEPEPAKPNPRAPPRR